MSDRTFNEFKIGNAESLLWMEDNYVEWPRHLTQRMIDPSAAVCVCVAEVAIGFKIVRSQSEQSRRRAERARTHSARKEIACV